jgi:hypothetical protein
VGVARRPGERDTCAQEADAGAKNEKPAFQGGETLGRVSTVRRPPRHVRGHLPGCRATSVRADDVRAAKARSGVWVKTNGHVLTWPVLEFCEVRPWKSRTGLRRDGGRCDGVSQDVVSFSSSFFGPQRFTFFLSLTYINRGFL